MLVLTRSSEEEIRIGDDIVVRVLDIKGDRVRLGIDAPAEVPVHRQEVYLEIERANREALSVAGNGLAGARELIERNQRRGPRKRRGAGKRGRRRDVAVNTEVEHGT